MGFQLVPILMTLNDGINGFIVCISNMQYFITYEVDYNQGHCANFILFIIRDKCANQTNNCR